MQSSSSKQHSKLGVTMDPALSSPACLTVHVCFPGARAAVMDNLNRQREEGRLCDLSIQVQGQVFRAHRCVLAASSPYFHDQVLLKNVTTVSLPSVMDPVAFESVLSSAYTGQLSLVHEDIVNYVTVASFLQMWHIVDKCTEILKRPRPAVEVDAPPPGTASRQQSPSSSDCLYLETESRRKERKPDALPPLATWRRPQQFPRWGRPRAPPAQQSSADSQLDPQPAFPGSEFSCGEAWDAGRPRGGVSGPEGGRQRARLQQRGGASTADRDSGDSDGTEDRRKDERRDSEANEGVGQDRDGGAKAETLGLGFQPGPGPGPGQALEKAVPEDFKAGVQSGLLSSAELTGAQRGDGVPGPSCTLPGQPQWQMGPWAQQEPRPPEGGGVQEQVDFFSEASFSRDTYDEIEDGTGRVSQRPLLPPSPDLALATSEVGWSSCCPAPSGPPSFPSPRHASSPPTPSSSSAVALAGAPYTGKVHFCHCGKAYTLKSMRDRHVKMQHLNLRPFGCPVCTKSFKMKHHLAKHLKTHGGLRPYECSLCGKKVVWRDSFLRHQARCQRLASSTSSSSSSSSSTRLEDGYALQDRPALLGLQGQVKVEDFQGDVEDGMGGLLGSVSGMVEQLRAIPDPGGTVFKEEAADGFGGEDGGGTG